MNIKRQNINKIVRVVGSYFYKFKLLWKLLPVNFQRRSIILFLLTLIGMMLETLGISLLIPMISLLTDDEFISNSMQFISKFINPEHVSQQLLIIYSMTLLIFAYLIKTIFLIFLSWKQAQFAYGIKATLSANLYKGYLGSDYESLLGVNSSQLIRNLTVEVQQFVGNVLKPAISLITELTIALGLVVLLIFFDPISAFLVFGIIVVSILCFQLLTSKYIKEWGKQRQFHDGRKIQQAQEGLGSFKEIKLNGMKDNFISRFELHNQRASLAESKQTALIQVPRLWLEMVGVIGLSSLIVWNVTFKDDVNEVVATLVVFAATAFRLLPSASRILSALQSFRYADVVLTHLSEELQKTSDKILQTPKKIVFDEKIELSNIAYQYPSSNKQSLDNVNFEIKKGETIGIIGPSGSGKSTLVHIILGLLRPTSGTVKIDGHDIFSSQSLWYTNLGYVPQSIFLTDNTLKANIAFGIDEECISDQMIQRALKLSKLNKFVDGLENGIETFVGERGVKLSGGQLQRIGIARALYHDPAVLLFDESTSALDYETETAVMDAVNSLKHQRTMIIIAHRLSTLSKCDRLYRLQNGEIQETENNFDFETFAKK